MSIVICVVSFCIYLLYYGPLMLISKFSFSIYVNAAAVTFSELFVYPLLFLCINKMKRRAWNAWLFGGAGVLSGALILVVASQCEHSGRC